MPNRTTKESSQENLLLFTPLAEPGVLTLAEDAACAKPSTTLDAQTPKRRKVTRIKPRLDAQKKKTGRPDAQRPEFDSTEEPGYKSRIQRERPNLRIERQLLITVKKECRTVYPPLKLQDVTEDAYRLWLRERARSKLDAQTPTGSCSGGSSSTDLDQDLDKTTTTTTTTTVDAQTPKTVALPGFAARILEHLPHKSRHSEAMNSAYANDPANNNLKWPDIWAAKNFRTGKYDGLIDLWLERNQREEEKAQSVAEAAAKRDRQQLEELERRERAAEDGLRSV